ncbi:cupin domain-containing protein [Pseudonocardia acaciae]|uniref:cupin domain-containing protein n=1 Tax=Pseudonocardia acaciae TaxID=551276 RepID=UPI0004914DCF|nr:cupin domain-containing protein [Pseudonocardia acaciae]
MARPDGGEEARWFLDMLVVWKCTAEMTAGRMSLVDHRARCGSGTPLHIHRREDEWFYVVHGQLRVRVGDESTLAGPGDSVFAPRNVPHLHSVLSPEGARFLVGFSPALADGADGFVRAASQPAPAPEPPPAAAPPDPDALSALASRFGVEILGSPGTTE